MSKYMIFAEYTVQSEGQEDIPVDGLLKASNGKEIYFDSCEDAECFLTKLVGVNELDEYEDCYGAPGLPITYLIEKRSKKPWKRCVNFSLVKNIELYWARNTP